jgi:hypothetical protein
VLTDQLGLFVKSTFKFTVYEPPKFVGAIVKQIDLMASNEGYYSLPIMEGLQGEYVTHESPLPRCATFDFPNYTFLPNRVSDLGLYIIKGKLWNQYTFTSFTFKINVTNEAPYLMGGQLPD